MWKAKKKCENNREPSILWLSTMLKEWQSRVGCQVPEATMDSFLRSSPWEEPPSHRTEIVILGLNASRAKAVYVVLISFSKKRIILWNYLTFNLEQNCETNFKDPSSGKTEDKFWGFLVSQRVATRLGLGCIGSWIVKFKRHTNLLSLCIHNIPQVIPATVSSVSRRWSVTSNLWTNRWFGVNILKNVVGTQVSQECVKLIAWQQWILLPASK